MLDLRKLEECQGRWSMLFTTPQYAGKMMNCSVDSWRMFQCSLFSNGNTSLLFASDTLVITQAPYDDPSRTFKNLTGIWSFNASPELSSTLSVQASSLTAWLTEYGLFGFSSGQSEWLYNIDGASNASTHQEPYITYRTVAGNTLWSPQNATRYTNGTPPSLYLSRPVTNSGNVSNAAPWVGVSFGTSALICIVISWRPSGLAFTSSTKQGPMWQASTQLFMQQFLLPLLMVLLRAVLCNVGQSMMSPFVRKEQIDGSVIALMDVEDILDVFTFGTKAERESMRNALMLLKSQGA
ncbi:hypothetical protein BJ741DRAFT_576451 [Chytriomyces cf. hyalinus JEL632]|nr:hypothetical protein BJ741DRAFT_576451 [Chytriomyces cf. hyalinus JEL632]